MRDGNVIRKPGFDGEYGVISVFTEKERARIKNGATLINIDLSREKQDEARDGDEIPSMCTPLNQIQEPAQPLTFNPAQQAAIDAGPGPVLVLAGPGTGKTQTLMGRVAQLIDQGVKPRRILA